MSTTWTGMRVVPAEGVPPGSEDVACRAVGACPERAIVFGE
jgi:ferredoxin